MKNQPEFPNHSDSSREHLPNDSGEDGPRQSTRNQSDDSNANNSDKVGSNPRAAAHFADRGDFGIPVEQAKPQQQTIVDGSMDDRPLGTRMPSNSPDSFRESGVGAPNSGPGSGSGGDIDTDFIGVGSGRGLSASPERRTEGPDIIETINDDATLGPPSKGENQLPAGQHGTTGKIEGTVHDRMDREVHLGTSDELKRQGGQSVEEISENVDRSSGEDVDDREASTGSE